MLSLLFFVYVKFVIFVCYFLYFVYVKFVIFVCYFSFMLSL